MFEFEARRTLAQTNCISGTACTPGYQGRMRLLVAPGYNVESHPVEENSIYVEAWIGVVVFVGGGGVVIIAIVVIAVDIIIIIIIVIVITCYVV